MFMLCSYIKIGDYSFTSVHEVRIRRSIHNPTATAVIKLPATAVLKQNGKTVTHTETAKEIKVKDKVEIRLGYDNQLHREFTGYVKRLNYKRPVEIECEDEYFQIRETDCVFSAKETTLKACLQSVLPQVSLASCADLTLKNFVLNHDSGSKLVGLLKKDYGLTVFFDLDGKLHAGKAYSQPGETVKYRLRENVIKDENLQCQLAKDVRLKVKAICYYRDGSRIESEIGEKGGETKTLYFHDVKNKAELETLAEEELKRYSYDGYRGKIETFLEPFALPGMAAELKDPVYPERSGTYYIESTEVSFGMSGARRTIEIGVKI